MFPPHVHTDHEGMSVERAETLVKISPGHTRRKHCRYQSRTAFAPGAGPRAPGESRS